MGRRSPQNPRYQRHADIGTTRRSAASAKPKRGAGNAGDSSAGKSKGSGASKKPTRQLDIVPDTPEFRRWRKIWVGLLVAAIVFSLSAWFFRESMSGNLSLVFAYSCIFSSFFIEFTKLRPMRKEWIELKAGGKKAEKRADKPDAGTDAGEKVETKKGDV
jgi:hypothetical protein